MNDTSAPSAASSEVTAFRSAADRPVSTTWPPWRASSRGDQRPDAAGGAGDQGRAALAQNVGSTHLIGSSKELAELPAVAATFSAHQAEIAAA